MYTRTNMEANHHEFELPGFRFHPTEEELLEFYLKKMVLGNNSCSEVIGYLNIYQYDPWILPGNFISPYLLLYLNKPGFYKNQFMS